MAENKEIIPVQQLPSADSTFVRYSIIASGQYTPEDLENPSVGSRWTILTGWI